MLDAAQRSLAIEPGDAARGLHRHDGSHAQLDRLPDRVIHAVGRGEALNQRDRERRFALDRAPHVDAGDNAATIDTGQPRGTFAALAVEERDRGAGRKPQNARGMMRRACRQGDLRACGNGRRTEKAWRHALRAGEPATMSQPKRAATGRAEAPTRGRVAIALFIYVSQTT